MFQEFAVDPGAIVRSDRDLVYVLEKFGMHQGSGFFGLLATV